MGLKNYITLIRRYSIFYIVCLFSEFISRRLLFFCYKFKFKLLGIKHLIVELFNGKKMILDPNDRGLSHDLLFDPKKHREEYASSYIIDIYKKNPQKVFFDLGCNLGYYSILLSDYFDKIIGVEPVKSSAKICILNSKVNKFEDKFTLIEGAIAPKSGFVKIDDKAAKNLVNVSKVGEKSSENNCQSYTISEICNLQKIKKIDFLKMDIEGYEYEIIVEGENKFFKYAPERIFLEIHFDILGPEKSIAVLNALKNNGYFVERAFSEIKVKTNWLGPFSKMYRWFIEKVIMKHQFGEIYKEVGIDEIINNKKIINANHGAIEFIFKK